MTFLLRHWAASIRNLLLQPIRLVLAVKRDSPPLNTLRRIGTASCGRGPITGSPFSPWRVNHETPLRIQISNFFLLFFLAFLHLKFWQKRPTNFQFRLFPLPVVDIYKFNTTFCYFCIFSFYLIFVTLQSFLPWGKKTPFFFPLEASVKEITISRLIS